MNSMRQLYQEVIIDHGRKPRNFFVSENANHQADGHNPLCGDKLRLYVNLENNSIKDISFQGSGCAISMASASLMTETLKGKTVVEAEVLFDIFHQLMMGKEIDEEKMAQLDKLVVLAGVKEYPARVKCATLAWHTLNASLENHGTVTPVSTEE